MSSEKISLLLDTNCLFDLHDSQRSQKDSVLKLISCHDSGNCVVSLNAISASENPRKGGTRLLKFGEFEQWLEGIYLSHLPVLPPLFVWGVTFWGQGLWGGQNENSLIAKIHDAMFPNNYLGWPEEAQKCNADLEDRSSRVYRDWVNRHCDIQMAWTAIHFNQDILVTNNTEDFQNKFSELYQLGLRAILNPDEAVALLKSKLAI
jgi:hypothetical protein